MTKKSFVVILTLSIIASISLSLVAFVLGNYKLAKGFPFEWSSFNFLGSNTNYGALFIDIIFWFVIIWGIWKIFFSKSKSKSKK